MVRLSDLHEVEATHMRERAQKMQPVDAAPWITPKPLRLNFQTKPSLIRP